MVAAGIAAMTPYCRRIPEQSGKFLQHHNQQFRNADDVGVSCAMDVIVCLELLSRKR
jgi:hypothetical protein